MSLRLVLFDMDGVLFEGKNFWLDLHHAYGTAEEGLAFAKLYLDNDYDNLATLVVEQLWKGRSSTPYWNLVNSRSYQPGVRQVFSFLHEHGLLSAIVSSGSFHLAERAKRELGLDAVRANRILFEHEQISGVEVQVRDNGKLIAARLLLAELGIPAEDTAFVGDSDSDVELATAVALSVAYDPVSEKLTQACQHVLKHGELPRLVDLIQKHDRDRR